MYDVRVRAANGEINTQSERVWYERVYHPIKRDIGEPRWPCIVVAEMFGPVFNRDQSDRGNW